MRCSGQSFKGNSWLWQFVRPNLQYNQCSQPTGSHLQRTIEPFSSYGDICRSNGLGWVPLFVGLLQGYWYRYWYWYRCWLEDPSY